MEGAERAEELMLVLEDKLDKTASVLRESFANIRAGRANPHVLDKVLVDYYGKWAASGEPGAPRYRKLSGVGQIDAIRASIVDALKQ